MSWREDYVREHAQRVVGPGYGWAGGKFGRLLTTAIRWAGGLLAIVLLILWVMNGAHLSDLGIGSKPGADSPAKPKGGF